MRLNDKYVRQLYTATTKNLKLDILPELSISSVHAYFSAYPDKNLNYFGLNVSVEDFLNQVSSLCVAFNGHLPIEQQTEENDNPIISFFITYTRDKVSKSIYLCVDRQLSQSEIDTIISTLNLGSLRQIDNNLFELLGKSF